jgi:hypothetical protein
MSVTAWKTRAERLHCSAHVIDQEAAGRDQRLSGIDYFKVCVGLRGAMDDWTQKPRIAPTKAGQRLSA